MDAGPLRDESDEALLQKTPFSFDVSFREFFWPLMVGARLVVARPGGHRDPAYLVETIRREGITVAHFVPSMLPLFLEHPDAALCTGLLRVPVSGEAVSAALARQFHERLPGMELTQWQRKAMLSTDWLYLYFLSDKSLR